MTKPKPNPSTNPEEASLDGDPVPSDAFKPTGEYNEDLQDLTKPTSGQRAADDVKRHASALGGAVVGGLAGSFIPIVGTIGGAIVGAVVGHLNDRRRQ